MKSEKRWMSYWRRNAVRVMSYLTVLCLVAAGCTTPVQREEADMKPATADELTALLQQRELAVRTMKGLFSAKVRGGIIPIATRVEGAIYYRRPSAMRLRGFTAIGSELFEFLQADDQFTLRLPTMGRVLSGHPSDMSDMGKLARPIQLSVWAMSGVLGTGTINSGETVRVVDEGQRDRLDVFRASPSGSPTLHRRLWFDRQARLVVKEDRLTEGGEIDATILYEDFRPVGEAAGLSIPGDGQLLRPFKISLEDGQRHGNVQVTFHEIIPNATLKPSELAQGTPSLSENVATGTDDGRRPPIQDLP
jgi:hypothetical protein